MPAPTVAYCNEERISKQSGMFTDVHYTTLRHPHSLLLGRFARELKLINRSAFGDFLPIRRITVF